MESGEVDVRLITTPTHGRVLVREARAAAARGVLVGFHGYMEHAALQMERLTAVRGADRWTLLSIQALHRFYRGRTQDVVASWMTREDREAMLADNLEYVDAALDSVPHGPSTPIVYAGFSQGGAMAFRAGVRGRRQAAGIVAVGSDVPPELLADPAAVFPPVFLVRGARDAWLTGDQFAADLNALAPRTRVRALEFDGEHEWNAAVGEGLADFLASIRPDI